MFEPLFSFIRDQYQTLDFIPLHAPVFKGNEIQYLTDTIDSTFVSSVGAYVDRFEQEVAGYTGSPFAVATVNGTAALQVALRLAGVGHGDLVLTQALTFVATCNAIRYCGADPIFVDVERRTMGLSASAAEQWMLEHCDLDATGVCRHKASGRAIRACLPMHTFGHPVDMDGLQRVCLQMNLVLVEDAAESLGSLYKGRHTGTFGKLGTLSFNGNKIMTTGGGGMILSANPETARHAKHLTTTAKVPHPYEFVHDELGYNYRMPNLNAALGCAQLERLEHMVASKRELARRYAVFFQDSPLEFVHEPDHCRSNYWLNAVLCEDEAQRNALLELSKQNHIMTRPIWTLMTGLAMYNDCMQDELTQSRHLAARLVNLPSSVLPEMPV